MEENIIIFLLIYLFSMMVQEFRIYCRQHGNEKIATLQYHPEALPEITEANGYLIAAAPEMYAELADLLDAMEKGLFPQVAPGVDYPVIMEKKQELRNILKKARGEE